MENTRKDRYGACRTWDAPPPDDRAPQARTFEVKNLSDLVRRENVLSLSTLDVVCQCVTAYHWERGCGKKSTFLRALNDARANAKDTDARHGPVHGENPSIWEVDPAIVRRPGLGCSLPKIESLSHDDNCENVVVGLR